MSRFDVCPGCRTSMGALHVAGCDLEQCPGCGDELAACACPGRPAERIAFAGEFPGTSAARHFGWFTRYTEQGWERCAETDEGAIEDLHRVHAEACWIPERQDWARHGNPT